MTSTVDTQRARFTGKVAVITGAARGQGRNDAIRLAAEGADVILIDAVTSFASLPYPLASPEDLAETVRLVEELGRRALPYTVDVRDFDALDAAIADGVDQLGRLDVVVADAGVLDLKPADEISEEAWSDVIGINLTGIWHTAKASIRHLRAAGGGSIVFLNATLGLRPYKEVAHMVASKMGAVGLMRVLSLELAPDGIRVNTVNPSTMNTPQVHNEWFYDYIASDIPREERTPERMRPKWVRIHPLDQLWAETDDVSNAVLFLASDDARCTTGAALPVDCGTLYI